ncbi:MAG TPA: diguanylate cyclase [Anaerolineales bacterium]|nr:diguanylate cyclase [Anaerolineales bacterium]HNN13779.1 diguanylate cyclase [Anaerolineales bacterium]HNO30135.1 diguanylate cyclase [Anaerolineales bacterium]
MPIFSKVANFLEKRSPLSLIVLALVLVGALGIWDYATGNDYSFSLFYLLPILLTAWYVGKMAGILISIVSALTWVAADILIGEDYIHPTIYFWNALIRFGFFAISTILAADLKKSQEAIRVLAHTDFLSGAINSRYFHELLENEISRFNRYGRPFTLVYIDIDNFKRVNDLYGHNEGDQVICYIAGEIQNQIRKSDIFARLGGDEFAILFPETEARESESALAKIHQHISERLQEKFSFLTYSIGVVTFHSVPGSSAEAIKIVDAMMYSVKSTTKNNVSYSVYNG